MLLHLIKLASRSEPYRKQPMASCAAIRCRLITNGMTPGVEQGATTTSVFPEAREGIRVVAQPTTIGGVARPQLLCRARVVRTMASTRCAAGTAVSATRWWIRGAIDRSFFIRNFSKSLSCKCKRGPSVLSLLTRPTFTYSRTQRFTLPPES